jgi:hypothetical protein
MTGNVDPLVHHLAMARSALSPLDRAIGDCGSRRLASYAGDAIRPVAPGWQPLDDLGEAVAEHTAPLLGQDLAARASAELLKRPVVLTSSHHGPDCFAQTFQGRLIFTLGHLLRGGVPATVVVLACGSVPMDNQTFPRGLLSYDGLPEEIDRLPLKLPLFSNRFRRMLVSTCPPFDADMLERTAARLTVLRNKKALSAATAVAARKILTLAENPEVLGHHFFSEQATVLNHHIWKNCIGKDAPAHAMVYIEMEKIVMRLLEKDLHDPDSLVCQLLLSTDRLLPLIRTLDGVNGCWRAPLANDPKHSGGGTVFFWAVDSGGRRVPLCLDHDSDGSWHLKAEEGSSGVIVALRPADLVTGMRQQRLLPSLFTCFLSLALARGVVCVGGYYQCAYLRRMQQGVVQVLERTGAAEEVVRAVAAVPTQRYIDGMAAVFHSIGGRYLVPAGPLEIMASDPLSNTELDALGSLTVQQAHLADLFETILDIPQKQARAPGVRQALAEATFHLLGNRAVIR